MAKINQEMPHSLEAEQALLGCLLMDTRIQVEEAPFLTEDDFYSEANKTVFRAMKDLISQNKAVDIVTLTEALEKSGSLESAGGITYLTGLTDIMPSSANYREYLDIVTTDRVLRQLIQGSSQIINNCLNGKSKVEALNSAEKIVFDISEQADTGEAVKMSAIMPDVMAKLDELTNNKNGIRGIPTGYRGLDSLLNGLHPSDLFILAARPSVGKTSLAMNIVENVAREGYSCAVFSLEMSKEQLAMRMLCSVAGVNMGNVLKGSITKDEWKKITAARIELSKERIFVDESSMITPQEVMSRCRRLKRKYGLDLVVIDYIQLMSSPLSRKSENRQQEISEISRNLKIMAKELNVPVIALSQLSRAVEARRGRPQLSDLRESGAIEQDADIVAFIHRPDKGATEEEMREGKIKKDVAEILIEKHRNGECGVVNLYFKGEITTFLNYNDQTGEYEEKKSPIKEPSTVSEVKGYEDLPNDITEGVIDEITDEDVLKEDKGEDKGDNADPVFGDNK